MNLRSILERKFWRGFLGFLLLSMPFIIISWSADNHLFLSQWHAGLLDKALLARDYSRLELIGFNYPPLPLLLIMLAPTPLAVSLMGSLAAGGIALLLWRQLAELPLPMIGRFLLLCLTMLSFNMVFVSTQALSEILAILLLLLAWSYYQTFTRQGDTRAGFIAGLILALAFFTDFYAFIFSLVLALLSPLALKERSPGRSLSVVLVLIFPALLGAGGWLFLNGIFAQDPFRFLREPSLQILQSTGGELTQPRNNAQIFLYMEMLLPYFVSGVFALRYQARLMPAYLAPLVVFFIGGLLNVPVPLAFAVCVVTVIAVYALPAQAAVLRSLLLIGALLVQTVYSYASPLSTEQSDFYSAAFTGRTNPRDEQELRLAGELQAAPAHSILADDRYMYRLVARGGSSRPYLLPADSRFIPALTQPIRYVRRVLIYEDGENGHSAIWQRYNRQPPPWFELERELPYGRLYEPVLGPSPF